MIISDVLTETLLAQVDDPTKIISDHVKVRVVCACGVEKEIGTRALKRKWSGKPEYLCKSCHVKTYVSDETRVAKFKKSFAKIANTPEHLKKCSEAGKKPWQDPETRARITEAVRQDNKTNPLKKRAREIALAALREKPWFKDHMSKMRLCQRDKPSILEDIVAQILDDRTISYIRQYQLGYYAYDFLIMSVDDKFLLEVQGEYWYANTCSKDSAKATQAVQAGYRIHHLWEHEFNSIGSVSAKLAGWLSSEPVELVPFSFNDISLKQIETYDARVFLGAYHYLPATSKFGYHIGAYLDDKLIAVCTFSSITRKQSAERLGMGSTSVRELSRYCIHPARHQKNFASWMLSRAVKLFKRDNHKVKVLISFADTTQGHTGTIYRASNWRFDGITKPSYHYISDKGHIVHKKTIWDRAKKLSISESEYAELNRCVKIKSKCKNRFVLYLS